MHQKVCVCGGWGGGGGNYVVFHSVLIISILTVLQVFQQVHRLE